MKSNGVDAETEVTKKARVFWDESAQIHSETAYKYYNGIGSRYLYYETRLQRILEELD